MRLPNDTHFMHCQNGDCESAACIVRRESEDRLIQLEMHNATLEDELAEARAENAALKERVEYLEDIRTPAEWTPARQKEIEGYNVSLAAESAAMRSALKSAYGFVDAHDNVGHTRVKIQEALSPSAGSALLERMRLLEKVANAAEESIVASSDDGHGGIVGDAFWHPTEIKLREALAELRETGDL